MGKRPCTQTQNQDGGGGVLGSAVAAMGMAKVLKRETSVDTSGCV